MITSATTNQAVSVLIVDDESELRAPMCEGLKASGYRVFEAGNVREARDFLKGDVSVDVVISDLRMPGEGDGSDLAVWLYRHLPDTIFILTSAHFLEPETQPGPMVYGYRLPKPFRPSQVQSLIERSLDRRDRERRAAARVSPWD